MTTKHRLLIVTTVPETLATILKHQPRFLGNFFVVGLASSFPSDKSARAVASLEEAQAWSVPMVRGIEPCRDLISIIAMIRVLRRYKPLIIHSYTPKAGLVSMFSGWVCGTPIRIHTFTGLIFPSQRGFRRWLLIWIDRLICMFATRVVPEGQGVKNDLQRYGITRKRLELIGYGNIAGVDTKYFSIDAPGVVSAKNALVAQLKLKPSDFVFCFIGRLNADKGISELVAAFIELPQNAHLLLIGAVDQTCPVDTVTLSKIESHSRIHSLGFQDDVRPALAVANIFVLPSYREGFPNVVLQAASMQRPVIASDINGCNEVVQSGVNGWLVPPRQIGALRGAMHLSMNQASVTLTQMGMTSRALVKDHFERSEHWKRLLHFYNECLGSVGVTNE